MPRVRPALISLGTIQWLLKPALTLPCSMEYSGRVPMLCTSSTPAFRSVRTPMSSLIHRICKTASVVRAVIFSLHSLLWPSRRVDMLVRIFRVRRKHQYSVSTLQVPKKQISSFKNVIRAKRNMPVMGEGNVKHNRKFRNASSHTYHCQSSTDTANAPHNNPSSFLQLPNI